MELIARDTLLFARSASVFQRVPSGTAWPDRFDIGVVIVRGADGRVESAQEEPQSESGDWTLVQRHQFDREGRTTQYVSVGRYKAECGAGIVEMRLTIDFDAAFREVRRSRTFRDARGAPVDSIACGHPYDFFDGEPVASYPSLLQVGRAPRELP